MTEVLHTLLTSEDARTAEQLEKNVIADFSAGIYWFD